MTEAIVDRIPVIDIDTHVQEPEDLFTSRLSKKWGDRAPRVALRKDVDLPKPDPEQFAVDLQLRDDDHMWVIDGQPFGLTAMLSWAGNEEPFPAHRRTVAEVHPAAYDPEARLKLMDEVGVHAAALFPNLFLGIERLTKIDQELATECVRAYNDFLADWCATDPERLLAQTLVPFWDVDEAVREIERCHERGHRAVIFSHQTEAMGLPHMPDPHWYPIYHTAQDLGIPVCFHVGGSTAGHKTWPGYKSQAGFTKGSVMAFLDNVHGITDVILGGVCERFPDVDFVSVESGAGYVPYVLEMMDWQWLNAGAREENPELRLMPSEYFRRQVYASFWFEGAPARFAMQEYPDNILYETDFPHPTSISAGPFDFSRTARDDLEPKMQGVPEETIRKVLHDNAARVYNLR